MQGCDLQVLDLLLCHCVREINNRGRFPQITRHTVAHVEGLLVRIKQRPVFRVRGHVLGSSFQLQTRQLFP